MAINNKTDQRFCFRKKTLAAFISLCSAGISSFAIGEDIQFNMEVLDLKERDNVDLDKFSRVGFILPGTYPMLIRVNKQETEERSVVFFVPENDPKGSEPCLKRDIVPLLGLKADATKALKWIRDDQCLDIKSLEGMTVRGDLGTASLYVSIPQVFLEYTTPDWDPPSRWDNGIPGFILDYNLNAQTSHYQDKGNRDSSLSGYGTLGANAGAWRLRADWQSQLDQYNNANDRHSEGKTSKSNFDWSRIYAFRALPGLRAQLSVGEDYLNSSLFDGFRYVGASIASDDNMLPPNLRNYAPEVSGVAKTDAKVTISQQGRVIYETQVSAGPFRIQDLSTAVTGKLDVRVEEQSGSVQIFQIETANVPYLTRPGYVRYKVALGKPSDFQHNVNGPSFATGEYSWGINNGWSLYGGAVGSSEYNSLAVGVGRDLLVLGALSFDVTASRAELDQQMYKGASYRLSYSKDFAEYDSQVTFASYRFSDKNYMSMGDFLDARDDLSNQRNDKESYTLTFNKHFSDWQTSINLNYSRDTYWDGGNDDRYNVSLSRNFDYGSFKNISLSVTAYRTQYDTEDTDKGVYLSLSMPFGENGTISYNSSYGDQKDHNVSYYDQINEHNNYQVTAGVSDSAGRFSGSFNHEGDRAEVDMNASYESGEYSTVGVSVRGGMTATLKGVALHRISTLGDTRLMIDTDGVSGIPVQGFGSTSLSNVFGTAVIGDVNSYYRNRASIDIDNLADDVEVANSVTQATLTEGAIGYRHFDVMTGAKAMAAIRLTDGSAPPFGAQIFNHKNQETGIVGDDGSVYLSGIVAGEKMHIKWDEKAQCEITLPQVSTENLQSNLLLPCVFLDGKTATSMKLSKTSIEQ